VASLFTSQTPASGDNSDGTPGITTATAVRFAVDGDVSAGRFYATSTVGGTYTMAFWEVTAADPNGSGGTLLASKTMGAPPTGGTWNTVTFDTPVAVVTTKLYKIGIFSGDGRYVFTSTFFGSDLVNGDITADASGDDPVGLGNLNQGSFTINAALSYPTNQPGSSCYFVDVVFEPAGVEPTVVPTGVAVAVALGEPVVDLGLAPAPDGVAVPVALGEPAVGYALAPAPTGLAVAVGMGEPTIGETVLPTVVPDGIAVAVALGSPTSEDGPPPARRSGGWLSFGEALRFNADEARLEQERPPIDCPNDGEPLEQGPGGVLHCPADGWEWPARRVVGARR
jgi:hypothetical protein